MDTILRYSDPARTVMAGGGGHSINIPITMAQHFQILYFNDLSTKTMTKTYKPPDIEFREILPKTCATIITNKSYALL